MSDQQRSTRSSIATVNPATGELVAEFPVMSDEEVDAKVVASHEAYRDWRKRSREERAEIVLKAAQLFKERREELAAIVTLEMGKLITESQGEVLLAASICKYYGLHGPDQLADEELEIKGGSAVIVNEPLGVLLGVMPWNFPLYQVVRFAAPNLVAGNTILLKHASNCPQSSLAIEKIFRDAGVPEGVYQNIFVPGKAISRIIEHKLVQAVSLTGSEAAGASVGEAAGRALKKCVLELGGADAFLVLDRENWERTVGGAVVGRMANTGQSCISAKRFLVLDELHDDFVEGIRQRFKALEPGDPSDPATKLGPLSSKAAVEEILEQIQDAVDQGATLVTGGKRIDRPGAYLAPTILTNVTPQMRAFREEIFGPVAVVHRVADDEAAIEMANDSEFGLGGSVFCADLDRARKVAERIDTGMVWINHPTSSQAELPFGGVKQSGFGRELSHLGILEFVNRKLIRTLPPDAKIYGASG